MWPGDALGEPGAARGLVDYGVVNSNAQPIDVPPCCLAEGRVTVSRHPRMLRGDVDAEA